jgi:hypothetical protein
LNIRAERESPDQQELAFSQSMRLWSANVLPVDGIDDPEN